MATLRLTIDPTGWPMIDRDPSREPGFEELPEDDQQRAMGERFFLVAPFTLDPAGRDWLAGIDPDFGLAVEYIAVYNDPTSEWLILGPEKQEDGSPLIVELARTGVTDRDAPEQAILAGWPDWLVVPVIERRGSVNIVSTLEFRPRG